MAFWAAALPFLKAAGIGAATTLGSKLVGGGGGNALEGGGYQAPPQDIFPSGGGAMGGVMGHPSMQSSGWGSAGLINKVLESLSGKQADLSPMGQAAQTAYTQPPKAGGMAGTYNIPFDTSGMRGDAAGKSNIWDLAISLAPLLLGGKSQAQPTPPAPQDIFSGGAINQQKFLGYPSMNRLY